MDETGRLHLSAMGEVIYRTWHDLPVRSPCIEPMAFIAMPDHVHGVLELKPGGDGDQVLLPLGRVISVFKSVTNHQIRTMGEVSPGSGSIWQKGFHDRVVRSDDELRRIEWYIVENPARWAASRM